MASAPPGASSRGARCDRPAQARESDQPGQRFVAGVTTSGAATVVADLLSRVAAGYPPPEDGEVEVFGQPPGPVAAVLGFTAHHVIAADVDPAWVHHTLPPDDLGAPMAATFVAALASRIGRRPGSLDVVLVAAGADGDPPVELVELVDVAPPDHPRVERARRYRQELRVWQTADGAGLVAVGRGLAARWEAAYEVELDARGRGLGRRLVSAARHLVPTGAHLWLEIAPGNVASLRSALAAGYTPVGAEVLMPEPAAERR
jgi:GNAT superfamily N-acetyltransferase